MELRTDNYFGAICTMVLVLMMHGSQAQFHRAMAQPPTTGNWIPSCIFSEDGGMLAMGHELGIPHLMRLAPSGEVLWRERCIMPNTIFDHRRAAICDDGGDGLYLAFRSQSFLLHPLTPDTVVHWFTVVHVNGNGDLLGSWHVERVVPDLYPDYEMPFFVDLDRLDDGSLFLSLTYQVDQGPLTYELVKFHPDQGIEWAQSIGLVQPAPIHSHPTLLPTSVVLSSMDVHHDPQGGIHLFRDASFMNYGSFWSVLSPAGDLLSSTSFSVNGDQQSTFHSSALDDQGRLHVSAATMIAFENFIDLIILNTNEVLEYDRYGELPGEAFLGLSLDGLSISPNGERVLMASNGDYFINGDQAIVIADTLGSPAIQKRRTIEMYDGDQSFMMWTDHEIRDEQISLIGWRKTITSQNQIQEREAMSVDQYLDLSCHTTDHMLQRTASPTTVITAAPMAGAASIDVSAYYNFLPAPEVSLTEHPYPPTMTLCSPLSVLEGSEMSALEDLVDHTLIHRGEALRVVAQNAVLVEVRDMRGQLVSKLRTYAGASIDPSSWPAGMYVLSGTDHSGRRVGIARVMVQ